MDAVFPSLESISSVLIGGFRPADNSNDVRDDDEGFTTNDLANGAASARRRTAIKPEDKIDFMVV
jgi:hypothetical protein